MQHFFIIASLFFLAQLTKCNNNTAPQIAEEVIPIQQFSTLQRQQMARRAAWQSPKWLLVASGKNAEDESQLFELLSEIAQSNPYDKEFIPVKASEISTTDLGKQCLFFVGNNIPSKIWQGLGEEADNFRGNDLKQANWWLRAFNLENPWTARDTSLAIHLFYGNNIDELAINLRQTYTDDNWKILSTRYGYLLNEGQDARVKGFFSEKDWRPDTRRELVFSPSGKPIYQDGQIQVFAPDGAPSAEKLGELVELATTQKKALATWFALDSSPVLSLHIYPSLERISLRSQEMREVQFREDPLEIHLSFSNIDRDLNSSEWYYSLLCWFRQSTDVKPLAKNEQYLDRGLSVLIQHQGKPLGLQEATLYKFELLLDKEQLRSIDRLDFGSYLYDFSAASQLIGLQLDQIRHRLAMPEIPSHYFTAQSKRWEADGKNSFQAGMTLAHEGYQIFNGYGGSTVDSSLDSLAKLAINSLAIVPYTFQRHPNKVGELPVSSYAGGENNAAIRSSIRRAQQKGWTVMLKPQIWVGTNSWPGDIDFDNDADWEKWFQRYTEWMLNYAIMANEEQVQTLCIGTELRHTSLKQPERWQRMIIAIRAVYSGRLTYAANWGEEFERLSFWDHLDVIGLNSYYPISELDNPSSQELQQGVDRWIAKAATIAAKHQKTWWLTEVGYRSVTAPWKNPHASPDNRLPNAVDQKRCYAALLNGLSNAPHFGGMYVWKWPSYLGRGDKRENGKIGFTLGGKPASRLLKAFYTEKRKE